MGYLSIYLLLLVWSLSCDWLFWDPTDCSLPGSSDHGISQARISEWVSFDRGSSWPRDGTCISCISRQILYHWATREALHLFRSSLISLKSILQCRSPLLLLLSLFVSYSLWSCCEISFSHCSLLVYRNTVYFLYVDPVSCNLAELALVLIYIYFLIGFPRTFYIQDHVICKER